MSELDRDVDLIVQDVLEDLVDREELHSGHRALEFFLVVGDDVRAAVAAADRALLLLVGDGLEDPHGLGALDAEELLAGLAVVADVLEVELGLAGLVRTGFRRGRFQDQVFNFTLGSQVEGGVAPSVLDFNIYST